MRSEKNIARKLDEDDEHEEIVAGGRPKTICLGRNERRKTVATRSRNLVSRTSSQTLVINYLA